jgi:hypothetical protein
MILNARGKTFVILCRTAPRQSFCRIAAHAVKALLFYAALHPDKAFAAAQRMR